MSYPAGMWHDMTEGGETLGDKLDAQERERRAQASADWDKRREAGRAWAYFRAGVPVPQDGPPVEPDLGHPEAVATALACLDDRVSALEAIIQRQERDTAPRGFCAD